MIKFTPQALGRLTLPQRDTILKLVSDKHEMKVQTDFSLPDTWIYFVLTYQGGMPIHGGISPEGQAST